MMAEGNDGDRNRMLSLGSTCSEFDEDEDEMVENLSQCVTQTTLADTSEIISLLSTYEMTPPKKHLSTLTFNGTHHKFTDEGASQENISVTNNSTETKDTITSAFCVLYTEEEKRQKKEAKKIGMRIAMLQMKQAQKADICFLVDCTGSMHSWLNAIKETVKTLEQNIRKEFLEGEVRFAFVGYTDYDVPKKDRIKSKDFTKSQEKFLSFLATIKADGGDDEAEDVLGGLTTVTKLNWREDKYGSKILIHIADAPPHGSCYHIPTGRTGDKYSDESPNNCWPLLTELLRLNITYLFGYIKKGRTDPMIKHFNETFQKIQGAVDGDKCNMEIIQFDAQNPSAVLEAINKTVSQSIGALERKSTQEHHMRKAVSTKLENDKNPSKLNSRTATFVFRLSRDYHTGSINDLSSTKNTREHLVKGNDMQIQLAELPFSVGVQNQAFHAYNKITGEKMVFKLSRFLETSERDARQRVLDTLTIHNIARYFAKLFNADKPTNVQHLYFVEIGMCEIENETNSTSLYLFEEHIEGEYKKFNSNVGWYSKSAPSSVLQAFSHYTWIKSKKSYVVCDLQGVVKDDTVYLTDPAVHCHSYIKLGYTNFSIKGMKEFFNRHNCNEICKTMQLEPFVA